MRTFLCVMLLLIAAIGAGFYFGLFTMGAERDERTYVVRLVVHPDFMIPVNGDEHSADNPSAQNLEASGKIASVDVTKSEFTLTENFKNLRFQVAGDTMLTLNGKAAKLAELMGGDDATVVYSRQGQQLNAHVVRCTRKVSAQ